MSPHLACKHRIYRSVRAERPNCVRGYAGQLSQSQGRRVSSLFCSPSPHWWASRTRRVYATAQALKERASFAILDRRHFSAPRSRPGSSKEALKSKLRLLSQQACVAIIDTEASTPRITPTTVKRSSELALGRRTEEIVLASYTRFSASYTNLRCGPSRAVLARFSNPVQAWAKS